MMSQFCILCRLRYLWFYGSELLIIIMLFSSKRLYTQACTHMHTFLIAVNQTHYTCYSHLIPK